MSPIPHDEIKQSGAITPEQEGGREELIDDPLEKVRQKERNQNIRCVNTSSVVSVNCGTHTKIHCKMW